MHQPPSPSRPLWSKPNQHHVDIRLWVNNRYPKWNPGKWRHGRKLVFPWWHNFDPYPYVLRTVRGNTPAQRQTYQTQMRVPCMLRPGTVTPQDQVFIFVTIKLGSPALRHAARLGRNHGTSFATPTQSLRFCSAHLVRTGASTLSNLLQAALNHAHDSGGPTSRRWTDSIAGAACISLTVRQRVVNAAVPMRTRVQVQRACFAGSMCKDLRCHRFAVSPPCRWQWISHRRPHANWHCSRG